MAALRENFQKEKKIKEYDHKTLQKFNSQNPNGVKREMNQIKRCWRRLNWLQSKKEHELQSR